MSFREGFDKGYENTRGPDDEEHSGWYWLGYGLAMFTLAAVVAIGLNLMLEWVF